MMTPTSAAGGSSLPSVIALSLACIVLLQSPVFTIVSTGRDVSPLEVAAIAALQLSPDLRPAARAVLFPGAAWREVAKAGISCYVHGQNSSRCKLLSEVLAWDSLWAAADVAEEAQQEVLVAAGTHFNLLAAACAVIAGGGLACFVRPIKMVSAGLLLLAMVLFYTPSLRMMSTLMFMSFLGVMMILGDSSPPAKAKAKGGAGPTARRAAADVGQRTRSTPEKAAKQRRKK